MINESRWLFGVHFFCVSSSLTFLSMSIGSDELYHFLISTNIIFFSTLVSQSFMCFFFSAILSGSHQFWCDSGFFCLWIQIFLKGFSRGVVFTWFVPLWWKTSFPLCLSHGLFSLSLFSVFLCDLPRGVKYNPFECLKDFTKPGFRKFRCFMG